MRTSRRHFSEVDQYSESAHWPGRRDIRPRSVSSCHLSSASREYQANFHAKMNSSGADSFDPYGGLNYRTTGINLRSSIAQQRQGEKQANQRLVLALAAVAIVIISAGMMWMTYSNHAARNSEIGSIVNN